MKNAAQIAFIMAILTLTSKFFGFFREMVMANYYGTSYITDAYVMAQSIPGILFAGVFSAVAVTYMPLFSKINELEGEKQGNQFTSEVINILLFISIIVGLIGIGFSEQLVRLIAQGFSGETASLTVFYLKITFSYVALVSIAGILESFIKYKGVFIPQVAFGLLQNVILIAVIVISAHTSYYYLIFGYLIVYVLRLLLMIFIAKRKDYHYTKSLKIQAATKKIAVLSLPVFIGNGITQINTFVDKSLASGLSVGSIAALNYGYLIVNMIMNLTATIMITIVYPKLTKAASLNNTGRLSYMVETGITLIMIGLTPCALGAMLYNTKIVRLVYERGAFDAGATVLTSSALFYYAIGLIFISMNIFLTQTFYADHNMLHPMLCSAGSLAIKIALNLLLIGPMGHNGLALSTSISSIVNTVLLVAVIKKKRGGLRVINGSKIFKLAIFSGISVGFSWAVFLAVQKVFPTVAHIDDIALLSAVLFAGIIYFLLLWFGKIEEIKMIKNIFIKK